MVWTGCWGPVLSSNMADFFRFLTFPQYFFLLEDFKSYSENALFNSLVCKKCFIMLLYKHFWLTIWRWKLTMLHFIKFKILPHTLLVIQFHLHLWANFHQLNIFIYICVCLKDKQIATKEHKCPNKIFLIKLMKSWLKKPNCISEDCHNEPDKENETELQWHRFCFLSLAQRSVILQE